MLVALPYDVRMRVHSLFYHLHALWRHRLSFGMIPNCDHSNTMGLAVCKLPCRSSRLLALCCIERHTRSISVCSCAHRGLATYASTKCPFGRRSSPSLHPPLPTDANVHVTGVCSRSCSSPCRMTCVCLCISPCTLLMLCGGTDYLYAMISTVIIPPPSDWQCVSCHAAAPVCPPPPQPMGPEPWARNHGRHTKVWATHK